MKYLSIINCLGVILIFIFIITCDNGPKAFTLPRFQYVEGLKVEGYNDINRVSIYIDTLTGIKYIIGKGSHSSFMCRLWEKE